MLFTSHSPRGRRGKDANPSQPHTAVACLSRMPGQGVGRTSCFLFCSSPQLLGATCPSQGREESCFPQEKGAAVSQAREVISFPVRHNAPLSPPCTSLFPVPLLSAFPHPFSSHKAMVLRSCCGVDRGGGGKRKPPVLLHMFHSFHKSQAALTSPAEL